MPFVIGIGRQMNVNYMIDSQRIITSHSTPYLSQLRRTPVNQTRLKTIPQLTTLKLPDDVAVGVTVSDDVVAEAEVESTPP